MHLGGKIIYVFENAFIPAIQNFSLKNVYFKTIILLITSGVFYFSFFFITLRIKWIQRKVPSFISFLLLGIILLTILLKKEHTFLLLPQVVKVYYREVFLICFSVLCGYFSAFIIKKNKLKRMIGYIFIILFICGEGSFFILSQSIACILKPIEKYGVILQSTPLTCGYAVLATVMRLKGYKNESEKTIAIKLQADYFGISLSRMATFLKQQNINAKLVQGNIDNIIESVNQGCIKILPLNFGHYIILINEKLFSALSYQNKKLLQFLKNKEYIYNGIIGIDPYNGEILNIYKLKNCILPWHLSIY